VLPILQGRELVRGEGPIANLVGVGVYLAALLGMSIGTNFSTNLRMMDTRACRF
jgi:hypothetical protein